METTRGRADHAQWCASRSAAILYGSRIARHIALLSGSVWSKGRARSSLELGVLHAIRTPRISTRFMACNLPARLETWRAFRVARDDNAP